MTRYLAILTILAAIGGDAKAQQTPSPNELEAIGKAAKTLSENGQGNPLLRGLAEQANSIAAQPLKQSRPLSLPQSGQLILFASASMGDQGLERAFLAAQGRDDITIVFRGALPGEKLSGLVQRLASLLENVDPKPNVAIHPKSFRDHGVTSVPTIIEPATGKTIRGTVDADVFERYAEKETGLDLGTIGPIDEIVEPDLGLLIKERMAEVDVEQRAKRSVATYWQRASFIDVPKAREKRVRYLDPTVTTDNDLRDHEGRLLAPAGTKINPLAALPFTSRLIIFDGTDSAQRKWAKDRILPDRNTILITTRIDRDVGWPAWETLHEAFDLPVYLLQAQIAERFALAATPSLIEAAPDGKSLMITEEVPEPLEEGS